MLKDVDKLKKELASLANSKSRISTSHSTMTSHTKSSIHDTSNKLLRYLPPISYDKCFTVAEKTCVPALPASHASSKVQAPVTAADDVALKNSDLQLVEELPASGEVTTSINLLEVDAVQIVTDVQRPPEDNPETISFGGREVQKKLVSRLNKQKGVSSYTAALMGIVFSQEEMAHSSITGKTCNFLAKTNQKPHAKKMLDPAAREAITDYVLHQFGVTPTTEEKFHTEIKAVIKTKLNNESTAYRYKKVKGCEQQQKQVEEAHEH
ncbi:uncharacterized protein LOC143899351 [Temnothorax americanus]|uniref:uncharacterized protein LOC143899351 n=1 Tax=Temnothorax americanus TaxID=1964332 RepID=UPI004068EA37